jgi:ABC-type transport system involved in cytochrome c biogenesis permease subunit
VSVGIDLGLQWAAVGCYIVALIVYANAVIFRHPERGRWGALAIAVGLVPHGVAIVDRWVASGHGPYLARHEVLSSDPWVALAILLLFVRRRPAWMATALVVLPLCILSIALALLSSPGIRDLPPTFRSVWLMFHIGFAKVSVGAFLLSFGAALATLARAGQRWRWAAQLPGPPALDAYTVRLALFGLFFWSITIAAGAIWADQAWGRYWGWDPIETWSLVSWLAYGTFLHARLFLKPGIRVTAWLAIASFAVFILAKIVVPFLVPSIHSAYMQ